MQAARKILPSLLHNHEIGSKQRLQAFIHLTGYMIQPLIVCSFVLGCLVALGGLNTFQSTQLNLLSSSFNILKVMNPDSPLFIQNMLGFCLAPFIFLCTLAPLISLVSTLKMQNLPMSKNLPSLLVLLLMCFGMSLSMLRGVIRAVFGHRPREWIRTPKYAELKQKQDWRKDIYQVPFDTLWIWELIFLIMGLLAISSAVRYGNFAGLSILVPITIGYTFVLLFSILQSRNARG